MLHSGTLRLTTLLKQDVTPLSHELKFKRLLEKKNAYWKV